MANQYEARLKLLNKENLQLKEVLTEHKLFISNLEGIKTQNRHL